MSFNTPVFWIVALFWRCIEHPCSLHPYLGLWWVLEVPDLGFASSFWFNMDTGLGYIYNTIFGSLFILKVQRRSSPWSPDLGLWWVLEVSDLGYASWSWIWYGHWSLIHPFSKFRLSIFNLKVQRTSKSLSPDLGHWWGLEAPDLGLAYWSWFG